MALYAAGRTTGLVCDSGYDVTLSVPVFEGYSIPHAVRKSSFAGHYLTDLLEMRLLSADEGLIYSLEKGHVHDIRDKLCFVA
jgi:actin-related protein